MCSARQYPGSEQGPGTDGGEDAVLPTHLGFRTGERGTHTSRTIMLAELRALLSAVPDQARRETYLHAVIEENVLGKRTGATRKLTAQRLSELYGLDPAVPLFRVLSELWDLDESGRPLLACLCANARDPLLRLTGPVVLNASEGGTVSKHEIGEAVAEATGDRFNPAICEKIARNAASSWTQSGHLSGRSRKVRTPATATPAATAYALVLGYMTGARGQGLFQTYWTRLLDRSPVQMDALARHWRAL